MAFADHKGTVSRVRNGIQLNKSVIRSREIEAERQGLASKLVRRIAQRNGVSIHQPTREEFSFAARVDITYWPATDDYEIHWHESVDGETPARSLLDTRKVKP